MSLWTRIFGTQEQAGLSDALALDLLRLEKVMATLGETGSALALKGLSRSEQLHQINRFLGSRLGACSARERAAMVKVLAEADRVLPAEVRKAASPNDTPEARSVLETGCASLGRTLSDEQVQSIHAHLRPKPVLLAHDAHTTHEQIASIDDVPGDKNYACYNYLDLWSGPNILELAAQERFLDLAQAYLGCTPTLYSINAFWSFPNRQPHPYSQVFHRDWEDYRSLIVFTLLTPVEVPEEGAHYYVEKSHEVGRFETFLQANGVVGADVESLSERTASVAPVALRLFEHTARRFDGPAGQSFCGDGYGLHRAMVPRSRPRLLLWIRFGNFFNESMYKMPLRTGDRAAAQRALQRIPATPRHQYVFRYLIEALSSV